MTRGNPGSLKHNPERTNLWTARRDCLLRPQRRANRQPGYDDNGKQCAELLRLDADMRRAPLPLKIDMRVLPGGLGGPRVESTYAFF